MDCEKRMQLFQKKDCIRFEFSEDVTILFGKKEMIWIQKTS